jgi:hypothetical protein
MRLAVRRALIGLAFAAGALALAACGGGSDRTKAQVRLVNAADPAGYPSLEFGVDGATRQSGVAYGQTAAYVEVDPDKRDSTISATGSPTALLTFTPSVARNRHYTVLAFGSAGTLRQLLIDDNQAEPANNRTSLRVINAAPDAGNLDIYVTAQNDSLPTSVAARAGAAYGELSSVIDLASGTWRLRVAAAGSKEDVRLDLSGIAFGNQQVVTLVLTPSRGGALVNALVLVQEGAVARLDNVHSRVRVLAGVADRGAVTAALGPLALMTAVASPALDEYELVPAGAPALTVSVNGATVAAPAGTLTAGGDYTLLVYGPLATPTAAWVADDNRLPTVSGRLRIRLVNATAAIAGALSLTVDALPVASGVAAGTASAYGSANANAVADLEAAAVGVAQPVYTATDRPLAAGTVYSVFVVGPQGATTGILRQDR